MFFKPRRRPENPNYPAAPAGIVLHVGYLGFYKQVTKITSQKQSTWDSDATTQWCEEQNGQLESGVVANIPKDTGTE